MEGGEEGWAMTLYSFCDGGRGQLSWVLNHFSLSYCDFSTFHILLEIAYDRGFELCGFRVCGSVKLDSNQPFVLPKPRHYSAQIMDNACIMSGIVDWLHQRVDYDERKRDGTKLSQSLGKRTLPKTRRGRTITRSSTLR